MVNGTLKARGSSTNEIQFAGGQIIFSQYSTQWNLQTDSGSIIEYAVFNTISNPIGSITINGGGPMILHNNISYPISVTGGAPIISNNNISALSYVDNVGRGRTVGIGINLNGNNNANITDNVISGSFEVASIKISGGAPTIQRNIISDSGGTGIDLTTITSSATPAVQNNTITYCSNGILTGRGTNGLTLNVLYNNLQNSFNIYWATTTNLNAAYNWWGTTNTQEINQTIYDFKNDFNLGTVNFIPFLTAANPQAVPNPNVQLPTPSPTPTSTSTSNPELNVSLSESASALNHGNAVNFTVLADGGSKPYTFAWYIDGQLAVTSHSQYFSTDSQAVGSHHVYVQVTDAGNNSATTLTVEFNVLPASTSSPSLNPTPSPSIPEFPSWIILPAHLITATLLVIAIKRKRSH